LNFSTSSPTLPALQFITARTLIMDSPVLAGCPPVE
jgi:hypothetical protein